MKAHEHGIAVGIGESGAIVVGRIAVIVASHHHVIAQPLEFSTQYSGELEHHVFFDDAVSAVRSRVGTTMAGVENHDGSEMHGNGGRRLGGRALLRGNVRRRSGLLLRQLLLIGGLLPSQRECVRERNRSKGSADQK